MKLGEKLVILRKKNSISQDELASAIRVSRQSVYKWESGKSAPDADNLIALKTTFGISIDDLLDENFIVELPQKKKRRKRISAEERERIQAQVLAEEGIAEEVAAPAPVAEAPVMAASVVVEEAPKAEPVVEAPAAPVVEEPEAEPVVEEIKEEPKAAPAPKKTASKKSAKDDDFDADEYFDLLRGSKKGSFFEKLFGKK